MLTFGLRFHRCLGRDTGGGAAHRGDGIRESSELGKVNGWYRMLMWNSFMEGHFHEMLLTIVEDVFSQKMNAANRIQDKGWSSKLYCLLQPTAHQAFSWRAWAEMTIGKASIYKNYTLPETNIAPTNGWLEYKFPFFWGGDGLFSGVMLVSGRVSTLERDQLIGINWLYWLESTIFCLRSWLWNGKCSTNQQQNGTLL